MSQSKHEPFFTQVPYDARKNNLYRNSFRKTPFLDTDEIVLRGKNTVNRISSKDPESDQIIHMMEINVHQMKQLMNILEADVKAKENMAKTYENLNINIKSLIEEHQSKNKPWYSKLFSCFTSIFKFKFWT